MEQVKAARGAVQGKKMELKRGSLSEQIVAVLRARINDGQYPRGGKLPSEHELIEEFSVSRTVIREAIAKLRAAGLVSVRQGVGVFIEALAPLQPFWIDTDLALVNETLAVLELRIAIEVEAAELAATRRTEAQLDALREAMATMNDAITKGEDSIRADLDFHRVIAEATGNAHFLKLFNYLGELVIPRAKLRTFELTGQTRQDYLDRVNGEHAKVYDAIAAHDGPAASAAMRMHLSGSKQRLEGKVQSG
jgi:GntR family transcriptional repressor for pyruvate dehydrogenase complex